MKKHYNQLSAGITLIALVVTIVVLLILAGISIQMLTGDNGILQRAGQAKDLSEIAKVEELANLELTDNLIGVKTAKEAQKGLAEILEILKTRGEVEAYGQTGLTTVTGITFGSDIETNGIKVGTGNDNAVEKTATFTSSDPSQDYYVQINGKKYPIGLQNGKITITKTEITLGTNPTGEITSVDVETLTPTSPAGVKVAEVEKVSGTKDKIKITGKQEGTAKVTVKYTEQIKTEFTVTVVTPVTVTFNVNGGTFAQDESGTRTGLPGEPMTLPTAPTITGENVFKGWYTASSEGTLVYEKTATTENYPASNTQVYAQYGPNVATVDEVGDGVSTVYYKGSGNWEVFFKDNGRTYLIYKGANAYESLEAPIIKSKDWSTIYNNKNTYYPTTTGGTTGETHTHLTDYLVSDTDRFKPATQAGWLEKYMTWLGDGTEHFSDAGNMAFTLFMLDQNVWKYGALNPGSNPTATDYYDSNVADWVIGGPTMEMMVATANTLYSASHSCSASTANGYSKSGLGSNSLPAGTVLNHIPGSNYHYYWLASPSWMLEDFSWFMSGDNAGVYQYNYGVSYGFRPVVCLKSNVTLTTEGASERGTTYVLTTQ